MLNALKSLFRKKLPKEWAYRDTTPYTPDILQLETRPFWRVFIPDEFMSHHFMHSKLGDVSSRTLHGWATTQEKFSAWLKDAGPASQFIPLTSKFTGIPHAPIRGQFYKLPTSVIKELDIYKLNTVQSQRIRVTLVIPYHSPMSKTTGSPDYLTSTRKVDTSNEAWMWVGSADYWNHKIIKGIKGVHTRRNGDVELSRIFEDQTFNCVKTFVPRNKLLGDLYYFYGPNELNSS